MREVQIKIGKRVLYNASWKRTLYMLCFCMLGIVDQRTLTCGGGDGRDVFRMIGNITIAIIVLSHYKWEDITRHKKYYIVWSIFAGMAFPISYMLERSWGVVPMKCFLTFLTLLAVFIWGYAVILTFIGFVIEKKRPRLKRKPMAVWVIMMLLMVFSRYDLWWPTGYFVMFLCFYLTDFDETERTDFFEGALNGIILLFIVFQGLCFLHRAYDVVRYRGFYGNCNNNGVFYLVVLAAMLTKLYEAAHSQCENSRKLKIYYFLGTETVLSFIIMTIGRSAVGTAFFMVVFALVLLYGKKGKKILLQRGAIGILCLCLIFPVCFAAARYIPALRHRPIWFEGEWNEDKVQTWDPWNSEKYIDFDDFFYAAGIKGGNSVRELFEYLIPGLKAHAAEAEQGQLSADDKPLDFISVRTHIYKYFWDRLNWRGHKQAELNEYVKGVYNHAHNIFLQFGTNFGIPVMIMLVVMILWPLIFCIKKCREKEAPVYLGSFLWLLIPLIFGMFEYCYGVGSLPLFMIFFSWRSIFWEEM